MAGLPPPPPLLAVWASTVVLLADAEPCGPSVWCREDVECSLEQLPAVERDGVTFTVPYLSNAGDLWANAGGGGLMPELALVVSHGAVPNPGGYFCAGMDAAALQGAVDPARVIVVAPWYLGSGADTAPTTTQLWWRAGSQAPLSGDWRDGGDSDPAGGRPGDVSSYRVLDLLVERLLLIFPALRGVVLWGDSAGGQVLARYALSTQLPPAATERLRILPSNPSSFPYLDARRWNYTFVDGQCELGELRPLDGDQLAACPNANRWRYGIEELLPPYVSVGLDVGRFSSMDVVYVQGDADICNENGSCGTEQCPSGGLDRSCAAMLQGPMRLWRGQQYYSYLMSFFGQPIAPRLLELPDVGHDAYEVARSPDFLAAAFEGWATKFKDLRSAAFTVDVNVADAAFFTSPNYLSVCIDGYGLMGRKWQTFSRALRSRSLVALTQALAPAYIRMGGTANDFVIFNLSTAAEDPPPAGATCPGAGGDPSASPSHRVYRPAFPYAMSACQWGTVLSWVKSTGLQMLYGLNALSNRSRHGIHVGAWDSTNALELVKWTDQHFPQVVAGWELGNEPEGWIRNFNMNISSEQHLADYRQLRKALPEGFLVGPDYGIQGCVHESSDRCTAFDQIVSLLGETDPPLVNISTFHYYDLSHNMPLDTPDKFVQPWVLDRNAEALGLAVKANREAAFPAPVWIGEGATASGGGIPNASGTYSATFLWLDKLGTTGRFGGSGLMRQSLFAGTYALVDPTTFTPRPTYWIAALWKQLIGGSREVLSVAGDDAHNRTLRVYARCGKRAGVVVVFGSSLSTTRATMRFSAPLCTAVNRTDFVLTGQLGTEELLLNGEAMKVTLGGKVPVFGGRDMQAGAALELPPLSSFFSVVVLNTGSLSVCGSRED